MNKFGATDWFVMLLFAAAWVAATVYLFAHPSVDVFGIWASMLASMGGVYHWLTIRDGKIPDAGSR